MIDVSGFPAINASLNATSALLLILGYVFIRQKAITAHTVAMLAAFVTSIVFLGFYLVYHFYHGATRFPGRGLVRILYFTILISHTILAIVVAPLILKTLFWAFKGNFPKHIRLARLTFPIWLYVSITGVLVYWMLYRVNYSL